VNVSNLNIAKLSLFLMLYLEMIMAAPPGHTNARRDEK